VCDCIDYGIPAPALFANHQPRSGTAATKDLLKRVEIARRSAVRCWETRSAEHLVLQNALVYLGALIAI
jgi:hypothetical protein